MAILFEIDAQETSRTNGESDLTQTTKNAKRTLFTFK